MTAWSAKVCTNSICLSVNGRTSRRASIKHADQRSLTLERYPKEGVVSAGFLNLNHAVFWVRRNIDDVNRGTLKEHTADCTLSPGFPRRAVHQLLVRRRKAVARLRTEKIDAFRTSDI